MRLQTKVNIILGSLMMLSSSLALALGFGEIKLNSALNQPLDAEIELINVRDLTKREVVVGLASLDDYERAGVEKTYFLSEFKFAVDLNSKNGPVVLITTANPVKEPYLNFILFAQWPSGKLLREYTILVDLPVFSGVKAKPVRVAAKQPSPSRDVIQSRPTPAPVASSQSTNERIVEGSPAYDAEVYGPVSSNDTLWAIAAQVRPDSSYSVQQTMLAIQRLNPKAFINNNINLLKRGQVLRIPDGQQISEWSSRDAIQEVAGQNDSWSSNTSESLGDKAQLEGSKNFAETSTDVEEVEGRVKLSSTGGANDLGTAQGSEDSEEASAPVTQELDVAQEELDAVAREKTELESRLSALDDQIDTMEKLVEVSNEELLALELAAKQSSEEGVDIVEEIAIDVESGLEGAVEGSEAEVAATVPEPVAPVAKVTAPTPEKSILDLVMENITYVAAGLGGLVLCIALFLFFRNRDDGFEDDFDDELEDFSSFDNTDHDADADGSESSDDAPLTEDTTEVLAESEEVEEVEVSAEAETEDVVGECDIHLAYGQYDQAEEKLLKALEKEPANAQVRLKLLEVLSAQGDAEEFDSHYSKLLLLNDADVTNRANSLREGVIDIAPFDSTKHDTSDFSALIGVAGAALAGAAVSSAVSSDVLNDNVDLSDDTLDFASDESLELELDNIEGDDVTVVLPKEDTLEDLELGIQADSLEEPSAIDELSTLLDEEDETLVDTSKSELDNVIESDTNTDTAQADLDAELDAFDLGDLELDLGEDEIGAGDLDDDMGDVEFDLSSDSDSEQLASEFAGNLVADSDISPSFDEAGLSFEESDLGDTDEELDVSLKSDVDELSSEDVFDATTDELGLSDSELNLDDIDAVLEENVSEVVPEMEGGIDSLGDINLDIDSELEALGSLSEEAEEIVADLAPDTEESVTVEQQEGDFDVTFNLEDDLNLEALDQELDALSSTGEVIGDVPDIGGKIETAIESMDEPVVHLDESEVLDLSSQPDAEELGGVESDLMVSESVGTLGDLQAEAANEIASAEVDLEETSEFDSGSDFDIPDFDPNSDDDSNLDFLSDNDETATKLDLARAYIDMGDADGAKDILDEILEEGDDGQKKDAEGLLKKLA